ncbi:aromatic acid exporter family protein [Allobacillus sp. GCM10007491]|uniref:Aromatic acid exporter family protein n=1 Tax=Allobacillus saliphilus TaxID=2912308 RepID=A0A941HTP7_9BACI|nr:aromatic acid exporter family protein [Allobacillus saliphilus]MBR7554152.1 aromatic acid exporter family protein [Allobacillus saliphilus]
MFKIGYRTIKTAIGAPIAIFIAQLLQLDYAISAAVITMLCIQTTRRASYLKAWSRFYSFLIGVTIGGLVFEFIGYSPLTFSLTLLLFIPLAVKLKATEGIITSTVIILHIYNAGALTVGLFINEVILLSIGITIGIVLNLYMPSLTDDLVKIRKEIENNFSRILHEVARFIETGDHSWSGEELAETAQLLEKAQDLANKDVENHLLRTRHAYIDYFHMREKQFEILERMLPFITHLNATDNQYKYIAKLFEDLSKNVHPGDTSIQYLERLRNIRQRFNKEELPVSREEFERQANLYILLNEIEQYLTLKRSIKSFK